MFTQHIHSKADDAPAFVKPERVSGKFLQGGAIEALEANPVISIHRKVRTKTTVTKMRAQNAGPDLGQLLRRKLSKTVGRLHSAVQDDQAVLSAQVAEQPKLSLTVDDSQAIDLRQSVAREEPLPKFQVPVFQFEAPLEASVVKVPNSPLLSASAKQEVIPDIANGTRSPGVDNEPLLSIGAVEVPIERIKPVQIADVELLAANPPAVPKLVAQTNAYPNLSKGVVTGHEEKLVAAEVSVPLLSGSSADTEIQLLQPSNKEVPSEILQAETKDNPGVLGLQPLGNQKEVVGKLQVTTRPLGERAVPLAINVKPQRVSGHRQVSWDAWNTNFAQLLEPFIVRALEKRDNPSGRTVLDITVWPDHRLEIKVTESQGETFTEALVEACQGLSGNNRLAFPAGARRKKHRFENEYQHDGGPVIGVDKHIEKGDLD